MLDRVTVEVGSALRRARKARNLSLRDVTRISSGSFPTSSLARYERANRPISIERLFSLTRLYRVSPVRLLAEVQRRIEGRPAALIDVEKVRGLRGAEAGILEGFIRNVSILRGDPVGETIALREGDLEVLATATGRRMSEFLRAITPALAERGPSSTGA